ncbi:MAG TPA: FHA domain-containing protein [Ramlibacter sp.]|nr:FHA domain-containing protein [Ramlibacter sp.]
MPQLIASVEGVEIKHVYLQKDRTTLGRSADNDIVFDNMVVSGHHCRFDLQGLADVFIEDLHSTNGTYINGKMVKRQLLRDGEVISIGNFRIRYIATSERPGFSKTAAMKLDPLGSPGKPAHAIFRVLTGSSAGLEVPVVKAVSTFGKPGVSVVAVSHRRDGFYVAHLDGGARPTLNGDDIGAEAVMLSNHDVLELAGTRMLFQLKDEEP